VEAFADSLRKAGITVMIRGSSGADIEAACGQLAVQGQQRAARTSRGVPRSRESKKLPSGATIM
jgi:hypothetical protein